MNIIHHFLLDIKGSMQIVSVDLIAKFSSLLANYSFLVKTIFPPHFLFPSLLKRASGKVSSSLVSSIHKISIGVLCNITLRFKILVLKEFMFRYQIT